MGNVTQMYETGGVSWEFTYNLDNQMLSATEYSSGASLIQTITYAYNVFGDLVARTVTPAGGSPTTEDFAYDLAGSGQVYAELSGGTVVERYLTANGSIIANAGTNTDGASSNTGTAWMLTDSQPSVAEATQPPSRHGNSGSNGRRIPGAANQADSQYLKGSKSAPVGTEQSVSEVLDLSGTLKDVLTYSPIGTVATETAPNWTGDAGSSSNASAFQDMMTDPATDWNFTSLGFQLPDGTFAGQVPLSSANVAALNDLVPSISPTPESVGAETLPYTIGQTEVPAVTLPYAIAQCESLSTGLLYISGSILAPVIVQLSFNPGHATPTLYVLAPLPNTTVERNAINEALELIPDEIERVQSGVEAARDAFSMIPAGAATNADKAELDFSITSGAAEIDALNYYKKILKDLDPDDVRSFLQDLENSSQVLEDLLERANDYVDLGAPGAEVGVAILSGQLNAISTLTSNLSLNLNP